MSASSLARLGGIAAAMAGLLTAIFWFIHPDPGLTNMQARLAPQWGVVYGLFLAVLVLTLFALIAIYAYELDRSSRLSFAGFVLSILGTAILVGGGVVEGFVSPVLAASPATLSLNDSRGPLMSALAPVFSVGGMSFALGFVLVGLQILRKGSSVRWAGLLLILSSPVLGLSPLMPAIARTLGSVAFGVALIWIGYDLQQRFTQVEQL